MLAVQLIFVCYAIAFAHFQIPVVKAMRDYVPVNNPYNKAFHNRGVFVSGVVGLILIASFVLSSQTANSLVTIRRASLLIPLFVAWYKIAFDGYIGKAVYGDFYYLGTSSKQDKWLTKVFAFTGAGEAKVIICIIGIIGLNLIYFL